MSCLVLVAILLICSTYADDPDSLDRIVGGVSTTAEKTQYQCALDYKDNHLCGGSLITEYCVLTAAHCLDVPFRDLIKIRAGITNLSDNSTDQYIKRIINHEKYNPDTKTNDVSILQLKGPLVGKNIRTIGLTDYPVKPGTKVRLTGFGYTDENIEVPSNVLREVELYTISKQKCAQIYWGINPITKSMMCTHIQGGVGDACQGDSGGPVTFNDALVGVISWGAGCASAEFPGVSADVYNLRSWIDENVEKYCLGL